ncbi:MAG: hypothetical protein ACTSUE_19955 [Promethearchaeota archaeon]
MPEEQIHKEVPDLEPEQREKQRLNDIREEIKNLLEQEAREALINISFKIIQERDEKLFTDALNAIRRVSAQDPGLMNDSQVQLLVDFLDSDDDILRAAAVLALKPVVLHEPRRMLELLSRLLNNNGKSDNCKGETIRLLGHLGTKYPGMLLSFIPQFIQYIIEGGKHVAKISLKTLKVISKTHPEIIEPELKKIHDEITDPDLVEYMNELIGDLIKKRELNVTKDPEKIESIEEIIPEVPVIPKDGGVEKEPGEKNQPSDGIEEKKMKEEIGAQIEQEFSKIDQDGQESEPKIEVMKEIKTERDLEHTPVKDAKLTGDTNIQPEKFQVQPPISLPTTDLEATQDHERNTIEILKKKQISLKEKALQRREEEIKNIVLEKKELELQARELELQRDEMMRAKLEKMEQEVKRKEELLREKELALKLKELEEKEKELKDKEEKIAK